MSEYIDRALAKAYFTEPTGITYPDLKWTPKQVRSCLDNIPDADVAPVVRCKDCKHGVRIVVDLRGTSGIQCHYDNVCHTEEWFCADGTKMDGEYNA